MTFFTGPEIAVEATCAHPPPGGEDPTILDRLVAMIDGVPAGGQIRATVFRLTVEAMRDALLSAARRGVVVQVLQNGRGAADAVGATLSRPAPFGLGEGHRFAGRAFDPTGAWSAYGAIATGPESDLHTKLVLLSATLDPEGVLREHVCWWSSANLAERSGTEKANNAIAIYGDAALYAGFRDRLWELLWTEKHFPDNDFYNGSRGRGAFLGSAASRTKVFCSPEQGTDLWLGRLGSVVADRAATIDVVHARFTDDRAAVATRLAALARQGAAVRVLVGTNPALLGAKVHATLRDAGIPVRRANLHDKLLLVHARHGVSRRPRKVVLSGSHNLNYDANYRNDEILVKTFHDGLYDDLRARHVEPLWAEAWPLTELDQAGHG